jgi:2-methylcitrate dehydratase
MSTANRALRVTARSLRTPTLRIAARVAVRTNGRKLQEPATVRLGAISGVSKGFSTMAALQLAAQPPSAHTPNDYDLEIKNIAEYVHKKPIDSELAVRGARDSLHGLRLTC